jgi:hypothetical protein
MMDEDQSTTEATPKALPGGPENDSANRKKLIFAGIGVLVVVGLFIWFIVFLLLPGNQDTTSRIRDVFIIFMALEGLVTGVVLIILMLQLATLINLLQNEIKPILNSTNETVNTLRGTATFLSDNLAEPVIKLNEYLAGLQRLIELIRPPWR